VGNQFWVSPLPPFHNAAGTPLANSTTLTDISPAPNIVLAAGWANILGSEIEVLAHGFFSTTGTPTLLLGFYYGGVAGALPLAASSAVTTGTATAWPWIMRYRGVVRSQGAAGSINGQGELLLGTSLTAFSPRPIPEVAASRTVTIDTTTAKALTVGAQWGTASASNTITCDDISIKLINV
jgi:hypothetical protein